MTDQELEQLRYPIGRFSLPEAITENEIAQWIDILEQFPSRLYALVENLTDEQLDTPYRPEGWTVRQTVHHVSDSHHHSYTRFKWALTEDTPLIKAYFEERWAELEDSKSAPIAMSLDHLKVIHAKLVYLLKIMAVEDFEKGFVHPETNKLVKLKQNLAVYAWHSNHHYAHIENLLKRKGWL
ncbi:putative metal-dependent hydrolase [Yeosuana sp. MJ-SS3]|uniref:Metal-dependent hydrolase n=1 Tax=Gilvirhabdus luticola TaxID=3079858 RepID=A0ABU3U4V4_9FLAO|nr:putative metal-dependent hydrolase [Yeosuana sp. MJ-SS3]MDU8885438.1 putative metal-dependent hydrolase [Yeosuana sp. MJ-SS3]